MLKWACFSPFRHFIIQFFFCLSAQPWWDLLNTAPSPWSTEQWSDIWLFLLIWATCFFLNKNTFGERKVLHFELHTLQFLFFLSWLVHDRGKLILAKKGFVKLQTLKKLMFGIPGGEDTGLTSWRGCAADDTLRGIYNINGYQG